MDNVRTFNKQKEAAMTTKDRRKDIRCFVDIPAEFSVQGRSYQGRIKNLNSAGFFIETENSFSEGFYEIPAYRKPGQVFALHATG